MKHSGIRRGVWLLAVLAGCSSSSSPSSSSPRSADQAAQASGGGDDGPVDPREPVIAKAVKQLLETSHLRHRPVDDEMSRKAFARYLEMVDNGKMFLLKEHVAELDDFADKIDDELKDGKLVLAHRTTALMAQRMAVVQKLVAELLAKPFDLNVDEEIETDPEKVDFAASEKELADRWRRQLKLEVLSRVVRMEDIAKARAEAKAGKPVDKDKDKAKPAAGGDDEDADEPSPSEHLETIPETEVGREAKARTDLAKSYAARFVRLAAFDPLDPAENFLNAVTSLYDPHTNYLPPATRDNFDIQMSGSLEGIGALLQEDDQYIRVVELIPGGASWRQAKLEVGDLILAVGQKGADPVDVSNMRIDKVVQMIRGPKGTVVNLTVQKPDEKITTITITRDVIEIEAAYARGAVLKMGKAGKSVGYIDLPSFYGNTRAQRGGTPERNASGDVRKLLKAFADRGITSVILDVRGNGGGLLKDSEEITGLFIESGPVVQTRDSSGEREVLGDDDPAIAFNGTVVVMVDRFSASAAEIVAAALQDYQRAVIVGTGPTHGKGTVQALVDLDQFSRQTGSQPLGVLKLTAQQFFRINGGSTQWRGVVPDIVMPDPAAHIESGERHLDNSIPWSEVDPLPYRKWNGHWDVKALAARSHARQTKSKPFGIVAKRTELLKKRSEQTKLPLSKVAFVARRDSDRAALEALDPDRTRTQALFGVQIVDYAGKKQTPANPAAQNGKNGKPGPDADQRWRDDLSRDPWVEETLQVVTDLSAAR